MVVANAHTPHLEVKRDSAVDREAAREIARVGVGPQLQVLAQA